MRNKRTISNPPFRQRAIYITTVLLVTGMLLAIMASAQPAAADFRSGEKWNNWFAPNDEIPATGDFNGDGLDDIVTFTSNEHGDVWVALSNGKGFDRGQKWNNWFAPNDEIPATGDFNGDGLDDIVTFTSNEHGDVWVALSNGKGFDRGQKWNNWFAPNDEIPATGDFNGDGLDDIVTFTSNEHGDVWVALSNGKGFDRGQKWNNWFAPNDEIPATGDFNGDGLDDIVTFTSNKHGDVWVALSNGKGFDRGQKWNNWFAPNDEIPATGDFNGDGLDDIVTFTSNKHGDVWVALSNGKGFDRGQKWNNWFAPNDEIPATGDFNGDGLDDIVTFTSNKHGDVWVALSNGVQTRMPDNRTPKPYDHHCGSHLVVDDSPLFEFPKKRQFTIKQVSSDRLLDAYQTGGGRDHRLVTRPAQHNDTQRWDAEVVGEIVIIRQLSSDRYLDGYESNDNDFSAVTREAQDDDNQRWVVMPAGDNTYTIRQLGTRRFLDAHQYDGRDFSAVTRNAQDNNTQRWHLHQPRQYSDGFSDDVFTIRQKSSGRYLDAWESGDHDIVTRTAQDNDTQLWRLDRVGYVYKMRQNSSGRFIDAHVTSDRDYTVVTRTAQDNDTQNWAVVSSGCEATGYTMRQLGTGRFLDAHEYDGKDHDVVTRTAQDNNTQRWEIIDSGTGRRLLLSE